MVCEQLPPDGDRYCEPEAQLNCFRNKDKTMTKHLVVVAGNIGVGETH